MNLQAFRAHVKTVSIETLDTYFDQITAKAAKARAPAVRLGYALALDELVIEKAMRAYDNPAASNLTLDEILDQLDA